jgi:hypothetical protein
VPQVGLRIRDMIKRWVEFYKQHRSTLIQPIVHLRRPDMQVCYAAHSSPTGRR